MAVEAESSAADAELLARFEDGSLPNESFHHEQHLRVAWLFVRRYGLPAALGEFSTALRRFAEAKGAPGLYHQTITWAYLLLIGERLARAPETCWPRFAERYPELLRWKPSLLDRYYTPETLWSDTARASFVMPDRVAPS